MLRSFAHRKRMCLAVGNAQQAAEWAIYGAALYPVSSWRTGVHHVGF